MKNASQDRRFHLPPDLRRRLTEFQHRVWWIKVAEGLFVGLFGLLVSYVAVFLLDRVWDTPWWVRAFVLAIGSLGMVLFLPYQIRKWVWRSRRLVDVARLLRLKHPRVGDRLLGIVELTESQGPSHASPELCRAAIRQVAEDTRDHDYQSSVPHPRHRVLGTAAAVAAAVALAAVCVPGAGVNALWRWSMPWKDVARYTFAQLETLPGEIVVPIGEPFQLPVRLKPDTAWAPTTGRATYGWQTPVTTSAADGGYVFEIPAQKQEDVLRIVVGDAIHRMRVVPMSRPELMSLMATVTLPRYLGYPEQRRDVRGGSLTLVRGSRAVLAARASRDIERAAINGDADVARVKDQLVVSPAVLVDEPSVQQFTWTDVKGLQSKQPFRLRVRPVDDEPPGLQCRELAREKVVLDEEVLTFAVTAGDDFGIRQVGVEWRGVSERGDVAPRSKGEYPLAGGGHQERELDVQGTFAAKRLGIEAQPIELRVYAEDYLPGRERTYSPTYRLYVLTAEQHMIWLTEKLQDWQRQVLEVRDQEQRLYERNLEFREYSSEELDNPANRRKIAQQAAAERANGRRLDNLTLGGEELIKQAIRNRQFNVNTLENWARSLQGLKDLAAHRMPSVANLLDEAAGAPSGGGQPPKAPSVTDIEASANEDPAEDERSDAADDQKSSGGGKLGLAATVIRQTTPSKPNAADGPAGDKVDEAIEEQEQLLAEFNRLMDEMARILNDLQGSTFVKRLKFAARREKSLATDLHQRLARTFGKTEEKVGDADREMFQQLYHQQTKTADDVSIIQEDLLAYFQRTQEDKFDQVYREMKETRVAMNLREVSRGVIENRSGESIAEAEYWVDQLDRWADMLVGPGCPGGT